MQRRPCWDWGECQGGRLVETRWIRGTPIRGRPLSWRKHRRAYAPGCIGEGGAGRRREQPREGVSREMGRRGGIVIPRGRVNRGCCHGVRSVDVWRGRGWRHNRRRRRPACKTQSVDARQSQWREESLEALLAPLQDARAKEYRGLLGEREGKEQKKEGRTCVVSAQT